MREGLPPCLYGAQKGAQKLLKRCSGSRPETHCHYLSTNNLKIINELISNPSKLQFLDLAKRTIHILWNIMLLSFSLPQILRGVVWFWNAEKSGRYFFSLQIISYTVRNAWLRDKSYPIKLPVTAVGTESGSTEEESLIFCRINLQYSTLESVYTSELKQS